MQYCKRLLYKTNPSQEKPTILLGVIVEDKNNFLRFRTGRREILLSKACIIALEDTEEIFKEVMP